MEDDNGLSGFIFSTNDSGTWVNDSWLPLSGTQDVIEVVKNIKPATGMMIGWKAFINDTDNEWSITGDFILTAEEETGEFDYTIVIIVAAVFISLAILLFIIKTINKKPKGKEVLYVYSKDQSRISSLFH